ncbi:hypothetical protein LTR66_013578, partial [Elasticomyces elasticus]
RGAAEITLGDVVVNGNIDLRYSIIVRTPVKFDTDTFLDRPFSASLYRIHPGHVLMLYHAVIASKQRISFLWTGWNDVAHLWRVESSSGVELLGGEIATTGPEKALQVANDFTERGDRDLKLFVTRAYSRFPRV